MLTMGSLFDGIGGFPLAAVRNGIVPAWRAAQYAACNSGYSFLSRMVSFTL